MKRAAKTLLVDDSSMALMMTSFMLRKQGVVDITEAVDGLEAVQRFEEALLAKVPFSLVFLDIMMPLLGGQETLKRIRALEVAAGVTAEDRAVIIMATALHSTTDMLDALMDGDCSDYLVKPFDIEDVRGMLLKYRFVEQAEPA
jgi:two-component system chemotaxis response regulator CheY